MDVKICCVRSLTNAQESFKLVLILLIFHIFSVTKISLFVAKITFVVAEMIFKVTVKASLVVKFTFALF